MIIFFSDTVSCPFLGIGVRFKVEICSLRIQFQGVGTILSQTLGGKKSFHKCNDHHNPDTLRLSCSEKLYKDKKSERWTNRS